jgi:hypothetical protein
MKIAKFHSHLNGHEWILVHHRSVWSEIEAVVKKIDAPSCLTKVSKEKTKKDQLLYSPTEINRRFKEELGRGDWREVRTDYWVTDDFDLIRKTIALPADEQRKLIAEEGKSAFRSYNQTDFQKDRIAIEVQFGKYAFISYDLFVKHMAFYVGDKIDVARGGECRPCRSF